MGWSKEVVAVTKEPTVGSSRDHFMKHAGWEKTTPFGEGNTSQFADMDAVAHEKLMEM